MGVYSSNFHRSGGQLLLESTDPSQANWITAHAEACQRFSEVFEGTLEDKFQKDFSEEKFALVALCEREWNDTIVVFYKLQNAKSAPPTDLTIPEVQRCWSRFLLLQPDRNGNVLRSRFLTVERFNHQLVQQMPLALDDLVTFQTFCSAVSWLSKANVETKLRGLYQTLTFTSPLNQGTLQLLLQDVYPSDTSESISQLSQLLLREIDSKHQGYIDEDQFVTWIWKLPQDAVKSILDFPIIPQEVIAASKDQSSSSVVAAPQETSAVTDAQLFRIASEMSAQKRDWKLLANHLGFLEKDSHAFEGRHSEVNQQILDMLQAWQREEGPLTEASALQSALQASGNTDISNEVFQLSF